MNPLVSVLTPTFNRARWLPQTLQSVANQTYPHVEHLVMDGGSADGTVELLQRTGPSVRWWSEPDRGESHALNKAFAAAQGEIIGWVNSDDLYVDRRAVATAVETFRRNPDIGVVYGDGLLISPTNRILQYFWAPPFSDRLLRYKQAFIEPSIFIRRSIITEPFVSEDLNFLMYYDLWTRLVRRTRFKRMNLVVGADRHHPGRKTLTPGFWPEVERYDRARGIDTRSRSYRALHAAIRVGLRVGGSARMARLPESIDPAIELQYDGMGARLQRQTLLRRASLPLD